jgi:hypothetical protein
MQPQTNAPADFTDQCTRRIQILQTNVFVEFTIYRSTHPQILQINVPVELTDQCICRIYRSMYPQILRTNVPADFTDQCTRRIYRSVRSRRLVVVSSIYYGSRRRSMLFPVPADFIFRSISMSYYPAVLLLEAVNYIYFFKFTNGLS